MNYARQYIIFCISRVESDPLIRIRSWVARHYLVRQLLSRISSANHEGGRRHEGIVPRQTPSVELGKQTIGWYELPPGLRTKIYIVSKSVAKRYL